MIESIKSLKRKCDELEQTIVDSKGKNGENVGTKAKKRRTEA